MTRRQVVTGQQVLLCVLQTRDSILQLGVKIASDACAFQGFGSFIEFLDMPLNHRLHTNRLILPNELPG
ncbi:hypothetical protein D3C78_1935470 [compost metagenome]